MGGEFNHPTPANMDDWMRRQERRMLTQERRSPNFERQRALGPGAGKYAKQVFDWNTEDTWLAGQFWSDVGSFNSPDNLKQWIGFTRSAAGVGGTQEVTSLDGTFTRRYRSFTFTNGIPLFTAWLDPAPSVGGFAINNLTGPWPTAAPGPTSGTAVVLPAGILRVTANCTAYSGTLIAIVVGVYMDGVLYGYCQLNTSHAATGNHTAMSTFVASIPVTAGTHYFYLRQLAATSDAGDIGSFVGTVLPT